jgi:hypothetical protein
MMALLDGPGAVDGSGRTVYAHPLDSIPAGVFFTDVQNPAPRGGLEQMVFRSSGRFLYKHSERVTRP